jgi:DNA-binding CsgD family transcriptional regulator
LPEPRTKPSASDLDDDALDVLFRAAKTSEVAALVDAALARGPARVSARALLLRARVEVRRAPADAIALLAKHAKHFTRPRDRAEAALREGAAFARLGDDHAAAAKFKRASELAPADKRFANEIAMQRAGAAWIARKLDVAERLATGVIESEDVDPDVALDARVILGATYASRGRIAQQGAVLLEARDVARRTPNAGVYQRALIASSIGVLAREFASPALRDAAYADVHEIPWTDDIAYHRFVMLRSVAWRYALDGDVFNAFRHLKRAAEIAPSDGWRVMSTCDRAYLADAIGEPRWAEQELSDAHELAGRVPWSTLDGEERFALSLLAERFAARDPSLALAYVARYKETGKRFALVLASNDDRRVDAMESFSFGVVQAALGETAEATRLLKRSYKIYDAVGYEWRSARAALELAGVTGDESWKERAREKLAAYPKSWLARDPARPAPRAEPAEVALLTPAQRAVYDLLLLGRATAEIAAEQGRSEFTIRNHIKAILKAFNVNSRGALLARASGAIT